MFCIKGGVSTAKVFTDNIEEEAFTQILELCNQEFTRNSTIRIMPDVHAGAGCTIGTTMTIKDKVVPNLVGVDIGCGMEVCILQDTNVNLELLDKTIRAFIPSGFETRDKEHKYVKQINFEELICKEHIDVERARLSIGTLGGGNHFIEADVDMHNNIHFVVHSGSRHLGKQVAEYYQETAYRELISLKAEKQRIIKELKAQGRETEIAACLQKVKSPKVKKDLAYLQGDQFKKYIYDMKIVQTYADLNRKAIMDEIVKVMKLTVVDRFTTIHNYIDMNHMMLRKGAISAQKGERVIIPINMRDGSIIAIGKGNEDWNYSAPHGAGRLMSRGKAKSLFTVEEFREQMAGIYSTSVGVATIDESPMVYKPITDIISNIGDTVEIVDVVKPIYNYKAA